MDKKPFDAVGFIMDYESGNLESGQDMIDGFQELINSGLAWQLQGSYGRTARSLIEQGLCHRAKKDSVEYVSDMARR